MRTLLRRLSLPLLLARTTSAAVCSYTDDYPGQAAAAHVLSSSASFNGQIEVERDRDVFMFTAFPFYTYTITATPAAAASVLDAELRVYESDATTLVIRKSSTGTSNQATYTYAASGIAHPVFIDVRAFAEFSSGAYTFSFVVNAPPDADHDGLPDTWESFYGLSSADGTGTQGADGDPDLDGLSNRLEYLSGSNPLSRASAMKVSSIQPVSATEGRISWPAYAFGRYRLFRATDIDAGDWVEIHSVIHNDTTGFAHYVDPQFNLLPKKYYRVEYQY